MPIAGRDVSPTRDTHATAADDEHRVDLEAERIAGHWPAAPANFYAARDLAERGEVVAR